MKLFGWSEKKQSAWESRHKLGYKAYMLKTALPWGIFMFIANSAYQWFVIVAQNMPLDVFLLVNFTIWALAAWLMGHGTWVYGERQYHKHLKSEVSQQKQ